MSPAVADPQYVDITGLRPPVGVNVPRRADPEVQAALAYAEQHRQPAQPLRVQSLPDGHALADAASYLWWWVLRHTGSGIGRVRAEWIEVVPDAPTTSVTSVPDTVSAAPPSIARSGATASVASSDAGGQVEDLRLDDLTTDSAFQSRVGTAEDVVEEYADLFRCGVRLPPISVCRVGEILVVVDGFHRVAAAKLAGLGTIAAQVTVADRATALLMAAGANTTHGLRRSNADKRRAVEMLLADPECARRSANWLAKACGVSQPFVSKILEADSNGLNREAVETSDGRIRRLNRAPSAAPVETTTAEVPSPAPVGAEAGQARTQGDRKECPAPRPTPQTREPERPRDEAAPDQLVLPGHDSDVLLGAPPQRADRPRELLNLDRAGARVRDLLSRLVERQPGECAEWVAKHVQAVRDTVATTADPADEPTG